MGTKHEDSWGMSILRGLLHFTALLGLLVPVAGFAQNRQTQVEYQALRIEGIEETALDRDYTQNPFEDVIFTYDPKALSEAPAIDVSIEDLRELSRQMQTDAYQKELQEKVVIPVSIEDDAAVKALEKLKPEDVKVFVSKKNLFLKKTGDFFKVLRMKTSAINKMIGLMNQQFFKNAGVIANANAQVISVQLGMSAGIGLSDWLMTQLRKSPYLADLPERTGFYFMLSTGLSIVRTNKDGKNKISIEPVLDFRRSKRIFTPFIYASGGLITSVTLENRTQPPILQKASFYKISSLTMISGVQQAGVSTSFVVAVPPMGGLVSGIEGEIYRLRLTPQAFTQVVDVVKSFIFRKTANPTCDRIFL